MRELPRKELPGVAGGAGPDMNWIDEQGAPPRDYPVAPGVPLDPRDADIDPITQ